MSQIKLLIYIEEKDIRNLINPYFINLDYKLRYVQDNIQIISLMKSWKPSLIILNIKSNKDLELCTKIREIASVKDLPIVIITNREEEEFEVAAFKAGINDYLIMPIKPRSFVCRIKSHLEYCQDLSEAKKPLTKVKNLTFDRRNYIVYKDTEKITLSKKEFNLLFYICQKPDKVFSREELCKKVWMSDVLIISRTIDVHIQKIRSKLGMEYIKTVKGMGYKFPI